MDPLACLPGLGCQLALTTALAITISVSITVGGSVIARALHGHVARPRVIKRMKQDLCKELGWSMSDSEVWKFFCELFVIGAQHLLGGLLVIPALLGVGDSEFAHRLAMLGILTEVAYDAYDTARSLYMYYITHNLPGGKKVLYFLLLHHQMSIALVLPCNLYYSENRAFLWMAMNLMGAGGFTVFVSQLSQLLDLNTQRDLAVMRTLVVLQFAIMSYTRVLAYVPLSFLLLRTAYSDGAHLIFTVGVVALGLMGCFNALLLPSMYRRMVKFLVMELVPAATVVPQPDSAAAPVPPLRVGSTCDDLFSDADSSFSPEQLDHFKLRILPSAMSLLAAAKKQLRSTSKPQQLGEEPQPSKGEEHQTRRSMRHGLRKRWLTARAGSSDPRDDVSPAA